MNSRFSHINRIIKNLSKFNRFSCITAPLIIITLAFTLADACFANNLTVSNVTLDARNPSTKTVKIRFDVSWSNSWRTKINHDAVWITFRLYDPALSPSPKKLCRLTESGLDPSGIDLGANTNIEGYVPGDNLGVFIRPSQFGDFSTISATNMTVTINYESCGFTESDNVFANVTGIEMVYIPEGAYYAGDYGASTASFIQGSTDSDPWYITSDGLISVTNAVSGGHYYVSNNNGGEDATGSSFSIPSTFPAGYNGFYAMKYEITEGDWVNFANALPTVAARAQRDLTDSSHKNTDTVKDRNTISCSGAPLSCSTSRPARAVSYLSWMDLAAFLDWAALRPMSELEYEKMSRGPLMPFADEFAWGTTNISPAVTLSGGVENGAEAVINPGANANFNNVAFSGGDSDSGSDHDHGPLRSGIFATGSSSREQAGASYYGVMELSGNLKERTASVGNSDGRNYSGNHGDGILTNEPDYEGNANVTGWPGMDDLTGRGVTSAKGSGFRGGSWSDQAAGARLRISDRYGAAASDAAAYNDAGGRGVRTYDGTDL